MKKHVFLDYASTTPTLPEVKEFCQPFFSEIFGNPSSIHSFGVKARTAIEESREKIAKFLKVKNNSIIFTGSGTEADNLAIFGVMRKKKRENPHFITCKIEHSAVYNPAIHLQKKGYEVSILPVSKEGFVEIEQLKQEIRENTVLISIHTANNEIGTIQPIKEIGRIANKNGILFHTDAVQAFGKIPIDIKECNIDLLSASSHKFYSPKGGGFLYIRDKSLVEPLMFGGEHEQNLRPSTENVISIAGMGKAISILEEDMEKEAKREKKLRDYLYEHIIQENEGIFLNGSLRSRLPNNLNITIKNVDGAEMVLALDREGFAISSGSACMSHSGLPSRVLLAILPNASDAESSIRVTLGRYTTSEDIDNFLGVFPSLIKELRYE